MRVRGPSPHLPFTQHPLGQPFPTLLQHPLSTLLRPLLRPPQHLLAPLKKKPFFRDVSRDGSSAPLPGILPVRPSFHLSAAATVGPTQDHVPPRLGRSGPLQISIPRPDRPLEGLQAR